MKIPREMKDGWERRFPNLDDKWTHWKIMGSGKLLAVIDGQDLLIALRVVEENYGKYITVDVCRATVDKNGDLENEERALFQISSLEHDEMIRVPDDEANGNQHD